ncbi:hypothetical protein CISIN_1g034851mg [Citrus sinensis]|uniref:Uncharacterized protein n=1 Tax=Citrus sinensis TaxID=2711 RepID=A0A067DHU3_CITSI|nr:hypothetical protein CISIN_1g034851mg [Citrus sinensis]
MSPAEQGTDLKLGRRPSFPSRPSRRKRPEHRRFRSKEPRLNPSPSPSISPELGHTTACVLFLILPSIFSDHPLPSREPICH